MSNFFADLPHHLTEELVKTLVEGAGIRIEQIVSTGHASPEGFWYDQAQHEWVAVLQGEARLLFEDDAAIRHLKAGDYLNIPAHRRHRVVWTTPDAPTVWLAVFYETP